MKALAADKGLTVLEVLVAATILVAVTAAIFQFMTTGDRVRGRSLWLSRASMLALNEAERIKAATGKRKTFTDSAYDVDVDGAHLHVARRIIETPDTGLFSFDSALHEIEIAVYRVEFQEDSPLVSVRVVHGGGGE